MKSPKTNWYEELVVEKAAPNSNNEQIIILPEFLDSAEYYYNLKTWIIIADKATGKIKYKTFVLQKSDAVVLNRFSIDTAPYQISTDKRAFAIRTVYCGSSRANPYDYESLSLFIVDDNKLKIVLSDLVMEEYQESGTPIAQENLRIRKKS